MSRTMAHNRRFSCSLAFGVLLGSVAWLLGSASQGYAQATGWDGKAYSHRRAVKVPAGQGTPAVIVTEFLTHGQLEDKGSTLTVYDSSHRVIPSRILQKGPGDLCRVAFQTTRASQGYWIYYGGKDPEPSPAWTASAGLLLETRRWKACDLGRLSGVQKTMEGAELIGRDYVSQVFHRDNPLWPGPLPFFSHYRGSLHIPRAGKYTFFTSSQDCSFLLIDGKEVVAAPGVHGPVRSARIRGEATLDMGEHAFDYVHAASGPDACMVAAWQPPGVAKPEVIPAEAFAANRVVHLSASPPQNPMGESLPDFSFAVKDEVPLAGSDQPLLRVAFVDSLSQAGARMVRLHWDFGDGQTSSQPDPTHIYLGPGLYLVKLTAQGSFGMREAHQRIQIPRALTSTDPERRPDELTDYLPILNTYKLEKLGPQAVARFAHVYQQGGQMQRAADVARIALQSGQAKEDEEAVYSLATLGSYLLQDRLDDPTTALMIWETALGSMKRDEWKMECEVEVADIALHELFLPEKARAMLDAAAGRLTGVKDSRLISRLYRIQGDYQARTGKKEDAHKAYRQAARALHSRWSVVEQSARRGAFSRTTEAFLRDNRLPEALLELRQWQEQLPQDRITGYLSLLQAQYWLARGKPRHAIVVAEDLLTISPDSPFADRLAFLVGECQEKLGQTDRARAAWKAFLTDYPGSPLVEGVKEKLGSEPRAGKNPPPPGK